MELRFVIIALAILISVYARDSITIPSCNQVDYKEILIRSSKRCSTQVRNPHLTREPQTWQPVANRKLVVFSAFYEARPLADGPSIRIIASGLQAAYNKIGNLYCQLWYEFEPEDRAITTGPAKYDLIYPSTLWHDAWSSHFIICPLPPHLKKLPIYVSISPRPCTWIPGNALLVLNRLPLDTPKPNTHGHCISTIYNRWNDAEMLVEMLEASKIIGHSEILVYVKDAGQRVFKVLQYYKSTPDSAVSTVNYPFPNNLPSNVWCQRGALNDCFYRLSRTHQYVTIGDMDELHVPRSVDTLSQLIQKFNRPNIAGYNFQHKYYRRNRTSDVYPSLITAGSLYTTVSTYPAGRIRCKSLYNTDLAVKLDLHFAYSTVPGTVELLLDEREAVLQHYRVTRMSAMKDEDNPPEYTYVEDRFMVKHAANLTSRVVETLQRAGEYRP